MGDGRGRRAGIPFTKMQGLGNDYLYIDCFSYKDSCDWPALAPKMADRHFGAGSDGIILVEPSQIADFRMRIFNSDGSEGDMCGNGVRCFARYVYDHGLTPKLSFSVETKHGVVKPFLNVRDGVVESVSVDMGEPVFERSKIPLSRLDGPEPAVDEPVDIDGLRLLGTALSTGNPHCVFFVDDVQKVDLEHIGPRLEHHPLFPARANIEFVSVKSGNCLDMRVWERGSGITLACGTGASASTVAAVLKGYIRKDVEVTVNLPGGPLKVIWKADGHVWQTGPAQEVYAGMFWLDGASNRCRR